jgi:hypothetical protein
VRVPGDLVARGEAQNQDLKQERADEQEIGVYPPEFFRDRNEVDVVGHQAVSPEVDPISGAPWGHQIPIRLVVLHPKEKLLATIAALRDVMRNTWCH